MQIIFLSVANWMESLFDEAVKTKDTYRTHGRSYRTRKRPPHLASMVADLVETFTACCVTRAASTELDFVSSLKAVPLCSGVCLHQTLLAIPLMGSKMGSPEHLHGAVPELLKGKEACMFFGGGSGRAPGHEVCFYPDCCLCTLFWFLLALSEAVVRVLSFSFRKGTVVCLVW
jgi:hypothetical protein